MELSESIKAFTTSNESPSKTAFFMPIYVAKDSARPTAIASISLLLCTWLTTLEQDAKTWPMLSPMATPRLDLLVPEQVAPSKFIFTKSAGGGFHLFLTWAALTVVGTWQARNSLYLSFESWTIYWSDVEGCLSRTWFLCDQIDHIIIAASPTSVCCCSSEATRSLKSEKLDCLLICSSPEDTHTVFSSLHSHSVCKGVSCSPWNQSHNGFSIMVLHTKLALVGIAFWQARHNKFLALFGPLRLQIFFPRHWILVVGFLGSLQLSFLLKKSISWLVVVPSIRGVWPEKDVLWGNSSKWDFLDEGSFILCKNSINNFMVLLPGVGIYQVNYCGCLHGRNRKRSHLWGVLSWKPVVLPNFYWLLVPHSPSYSHTKHIPIM